MSILCSRCWLVSVALLLLSGGCYTYKPPEAVLEGTVFDEANREASRRRLEGIKVLTLRLAQRIAEENNQSFLATYHAVNAARMRYYQSLGAYAPEITAGTGVGQTLEWNNHLVNPMPHTPARNFRFDSTTNVTASYLIFDGLARELNVLIQKREIEREKAVRMRVICMVRQAVAYAFDDMQLAARLGEIAQQNREFQLKLHGIVEPEAQRNLRPEDEVLNFQVLAGYADASRIAAVYQLEVSDFALAQLLGLPEGRLPGPPELPPADTRIRPLPFSMEATIDLALSNNPQMHIMQQTLKIAEYNKFKSYSSYAPTVTAHARFSYNVMSSRYRDYMYSHGSQDTPSFEYGIQANYLIFNGLSRYNRMREMQAMYAMAQYGMAETYLQLVNDVRAACANYQNHARQARVYRGLLDAARRQRDLVYDRYLKREASVDRIDKVQTYYIDTEVRYATEINLLNKALAQIEAILMVELFPED